MTADKCSEPIVARSLNGVTPVVIKHFLNLHVSMVNLFLPSSSTSSYMLVKIGAGPDLVPFQASLPSSVVRGTPYELAASVLHIRHFKKISLAMALLSGQYWTRFLAKICSDMLAGKNRRALK